MKQTFKSAPQNKRLTISQLAARLDLSTATVSLALRNSQVVAKTTRERVQEAARDQGYIYNRSAASLRTARTNLVGVTVHDIINPYFAEIFLALEQQFDRQNRTILVSTHHDDLERQRTFVDALLQQRADGLAICPSVGTSDEDIALLRSSGTPVVLICRDLPEIDLPAVLGDDHTGAKMVADHLISQGHKRIAMVGGRRGSSSGRYRYAGYATALTEADIEVDGQLDFPELMTQGEGHDIVPAVLALSPRPTAIMCYNDVVALGVMSGLRRAGIEPGSEIAVSGYDNIEAAEFVSPSLTSVDVDPHEIGARAAQLLQAQIAGEEVAAEAVRVAPQLRIRESTQPHK